LRVGEREGGKPVSGFFLMVSCGVKGFGPSMEKERWWNEKEKRGG